MSSENPQATLTKPTPKRVRVVLRDVLDDGRDGPSESFTIYGVERATARRILEKAITGSSS